MIVKFYDITNSLGEIIDLILRIFKFSFSFITRITFFGTTLFSFTITVFLLLTIMPIIFTLVRSESVHNQRIRKSANKLRSRRKGD